MMQNKIFIEQRMDEASELVEQEKYLEAVKIYIKIVKLKNSDKHACFSLISYCYYCSEIFEKAKKYSLKALFLDPNDELNSLILYLINVGLKQYREAIEEMQRFLENNPADLYRDTLEELMEDLLQGTATAYKATILSLAKKNNVPIHGQLSMAFFEDYPPPPPKDPSLTNPLKNKI